MVRANKAAQVPRVRGGHHDRNAIKCRGLSSQNDVTIKSLLVRRRPTAPARFRPELSGLQHGLGGDWQVSKQGFELVESFDSFCSADTQKFSANLIVSDFRNEYLDPGATSLASHATTSLVGRG